MQHYLLIYDRRAGKIIRHRHFRTSAPALAARFDAEREFHDNPDIEVVVLGAESWEALSRTHSRYFKDVPALARDVLKRESQTT
jgi:hypothetical protein